MLDGIKGFFTHTPTPPPPLPPAPPPPPPVAPAEVLPTPQGFQALPPNGSPTDARAAADKIWNTPQPRQSEAGTITSQPTMIGYSDGKADVDAVLQVDANQKLADTKLATLTPDQQKQYRDLEHTLENGHPPEPQAHLALQMTLIEGKLVGDQKTLNGTPAGQTLLDVMTTMSKQPLQPNTNRTELMSSTLREIASPAAINQTSHNTCTVTSLQIMTAQNHPAEYARIISGLATPEGKVTLANGQELTRHPNPDPDDIRTPSSALFQPAMMQFAVKQEYGGQAHYDNVSDADHTYGADGKVLKDDNGHARVGLNQETYGKALDAVTGVTHMARSIDDGRANMATNLQNELKNKPANGVPITLNSGKFEKDGTTTTDAYTVSSFKASTPPGKGTYVLKDAGGKAHTLSEADMARRLEGAPGLSRTDFHDLVDQAIVHDLGKGQGVPIALKWGDFDAKGNTGGSHEVLVTKIDQAAGVVSYTNPHGDTETMSLAEFHKRFNAIQFREDQG